MCVTASDLPNADRPESELLKLKLPNHLLGGKVVDLLDFLQSGSEVKVEVLELAILEAKHPAVNDGEALVGIRGLHGSRLHDIPALLDDVQLHQAVVPILVILDAIELGLVQPVDIPDVPQPRVQDAQILGGHSGLDTTAAVVATNNNMLNLQVVHSVVDDAHSVQVDVADEVGDVAVDKSLTGLETGDLLGGNA